MIFHGFSHGFLWAFLMVPVPEKRLRSQVHERTPLSRSLASHQILRQNPRQQKNPRNSRVFFHESSAVGNAKIFKVQGSRKSEHLQVENENYLQPPMVNRPIIECE